MRMATNFPDSYLQILIATSGLDYKQENTWKIIWIEHNLIYKVKTFEMPVLCVFGSNLA